jgi:uncharacterized PurR-regulated membrane protein YhhQ (DUF165 family)
MTRKRTGWALVALTVYVGAIVLANWMISHWGTQKIHGTWFLPVGFGLMAPSGTYAAGVTFVARDVVQRLAGRWWAIAAIALGVGASLWLAGPRLALASGAAFLFSETADFAVYTPLERRNFSFAVVASGIVGSIIDSILFLKIAGIPYDPALAGLIVGKLWIQFAAGPVAYGLRKRVPLLRDPFDKEVAVA